MVTQPLPVGNRLPPRVEPLLSRHHVLSCQLQSLKSRMFNPLITVKCTYIKRSHLFDGRSHRLLSPNRLFFIVFHLY